jgi:hypothetical protein
MHHSPAANQVAVSPTTGGLTPWKIIQTYSADEWEDFVVEWTDGFADQYHQVVRLGGSGDKVATSSLTSAILQIPPRNGTVTSASTTRTP